MQKLSKSVNISSHMSQYNPPLQFLVDKSEIISPQLPHCLLKQSVTEAEFGHTERGNITDIDYETAIHPMDSTSTHLQGFPPA